MIRLYFQKMGPDTMCINGLYGARVDVGSCCTCQDQRWWKTNMVLGAGEMDRFEKRLGSRTDSIWQLIGLVYFR